MTTKINDPTQSQADGVVALPPSPGPPPAAAQEPPPSQPIEPRPSRAVNNNVVFKSGPLFISSKGIGWTSWKKRWFILTQNSLVFFRSDPSAIPPKGSEVNLTLGGIDLNNSGSVDVKADKKLLTVLFPDGRDGRAFTLKAETLEDLYEWKTALETALSQAPNSASAMGQNGVLKNDQTEAADGSTEKSTAPAVKFPVIGRPILLALEDVDGAPSFLEKALRFIEEHGVKVEGILRQAAAVDDVEHRIREFEQGKTEFSAGEDAHVVGDCIKYVLRELPSSPVPASCCNALLGACRTDRANRVSAMRTAICETFPEPNRRLLERILIMMQIIAARKAENRMSVSAVAACMAPLLLRPLLAGECDIETNIDVGGDGSFQLLQAAAAANHAQAIVITLLEEYDKIFGDGTGSSELYSDSEESGSESEEATDDEDEYYEDDETDDMSQESDVSSHESESVVSLDSAADTDDDFENASVGSSTGGGDSGDSDLDKDKNFSKVSNAKDDKATVSQKLSSSSIKKAQPQQKKAQRSKSIAKNSDQEKIKMKESPEPLKDVDIETSSEKKSPSQNLWQKYSNKANGPVGQRNRPGWGRTPAKRSHSMESIDFPLDDEEYGIAELEDTKIELENKIAVQMKGNEILQANLEKRKKTLLECRLALEKEVARLREQLQKETDKRTALEAAVNAPHGSIHIPSTIDEETKIELKEIAQSEAEVTSLEQKIDDLGVQLKEQLHKNYGSTGDSTNQLQQTSSKLKEKQRDGDGTATSHGSEKSTSKANQDGAEENPNGKKKFSSQNSKLKPASGSKKYSSTKGEGGGNNPGSALTKLTNRLNFLKEKRDGSQNEDKEGQTHKNVEKFKKSRSHSHVVEEGKTPEKPRMDHLDRGRSESNVAFDAEKGQNLGR